MRYRACATILLILSIGCQATPETVPSAPRAADGSHVIYLLRHAEKRLPEDGGDARDPQLTRAGAERAAALAHALGTAGVTAIFSTDYKRTRQTVYPLSASRGLEVQLYDSSALLAFADILRGMSGRTVVVGHSNTTPRLVELLGGDGGTPIDEPTEHDRLYVVVLDGGRAPTTVLLRYGAQD